jgi:hypothetical protein
MNELHRHALRSPVRSLRLASVRVTLLASLVASGCASPRGDTAPRPATVPGAVFQETFEHPELVPQRWSTGLPGAEIVGATVRIADGEARLTSPSSGELTLVHPLETRALRGRRVRVSAHVRTDVPGEDAYVAVAFGRTTADLRQRARTSTTVSRSTSLAAIVDVDEDVSQAEISLVLRGPGSAWFDDITVEVLGPISVATSVILSRQQLKNLEALTRAVGLIRYRHPSDQAAELDWNAFLPVAVDRVMRAADEDVLLAELRNLFAPIAPTVEVSRSPAPTLGDPRPAAGHLVRWWYEGLGPLTPFHSWREGQGPDLASLEVETSIDLPVLDRCKRSQLRVQARDVGGDGEVRAYASVELGGDTVKRFDRLVTAADAAASLDFAMPADAYRVRLGVELRGRAAITLESLALVCDGVAVGVDVTRAAWEQHGAITLYTSEQRSCGTRRCLSVARRPLETTFATARDVLHAKIGDDLWIHVPLAVWSEGTHTLPEPPTWTPPAPGTVTGPAERIAILASAWIVLSTFYPGFQDQHIDWPSELAGALTSGAAARSTRDTYLALSRLTAKLHDVHAHPNHPDFPIDGLLPVVMRRFGDKLVVIGGYGDYTKLAPVGAEVLAIDHVPAMQAYEEQRERVSSSSAGWEAWAVPMWLTIGRLGSFSTMRVRTRDAKQTDLVLPHLSRDLYGSLVREPRPAFGAVLAPGVHYVDLEDLPAERWQAALPSLVHARAIVLDMRGYPSNFVFTMLGHFIDQAVRSPTWQIPMLEPSTYRTSYWLINPMQPRLHAKVVVLVDGRAASAAETLLQIIHDNHLATLVGEPSAGTNGNPNVVPLPGEFSLRFTGLRVLLADGGALQGRGIVPDIAVHQTLDDVLAGRDAILEAGIAIASKLIAK